MTAVYFFAGILAILLTAVLLAPLLEGGRSSRAADDPEQRLSDALEALREIEFEHETDKLSDEDYRELRAEYAREAIAARDAAARDVAAGEGGAAGRDGAGARATGATGATAACRVCEAQLRPGARFCSRCGTAAGESA